MIKSVRHFTTITNTVGATYTPDVAFAPQEVNGYSHCDVLCVVGTITGVTNTAGMTICFQELFGDDYVTTAQIKDITSTGFGVSTNYGAFVAIHDSAGAGTSGIYVSPSSASNSLLGRGTIKRIVTTASGNLQTINADVYCVFYSHT